MDLTLEGLRVAAKQYRRVSSRVSERILALIELTKRMGPRGELTQFDYEYVGARFKKSARTLQRWKMGYEEKGVKGVVPRVPSGRRARPISGYTAKKILEYRREYNWGAEVIQAHLKLDEGIEVSQDRINRYLKRKGLLKKPKRQPKNKHTKVVVVDKPGQHTQNDVKHLPHILRDQTKCYVYNFVDHASRWECKKAYDSYGPMETRDFVALVIKKAPFVIDRWQTDNGIEFTFKFVSFVDKPRVHALDEICEENDIRHVLIPPGEKELQGLVERSHRMDDNELYHRIRPRNLAEFNKFLAAHYEWKNSSRRRKALDWKTPNEFLADYEKRSRLICVASLPAPKTTTEDGNPERLAA